VNTTEHPVTSDSSTQPSDPRLVQELRPPPDPVATCERFADLPYLVFLDSAADPQRLGRHSFLTADPALLVRSKSNRVELVSLPDGGVAPLASPALIAVRELLSPHHAAPLRTVPPFQGGAAGYIGYDWGATLEQLPSPRYDDLSIPDLMLGLYDWVIAWDHAAGRAWIISTGLPRTGDAACHRASERLAWVRNRLTSNAPIRPPVFPSCAPRPAFRAPSYPVEAAPSSIDLRSSFTHRGYLDAVTRVREYIIAGDIFQANMSQRLEAPLCEPPWRLYKRLRAVNPAPFAAYLNFGELAVLSASPERFLRLDADREVETRPIKGTRPRAAHPAHDAALGRALVDSVKDRAENLMIVDLLRNDLSRVCAPGTVRVPELFALEHFATVHHLVSTVVGQLAQGMDAVDLLCATFPGGSITGAPKIRAMQIIAELEPSRRGVYCGSIGYLSVTGVLDCSIVIRTYLALGTTVYFSVGGGIVADSDPEQEYRETLDKARALVSALEHPDS
jgi:para-aminobenzoate synthetase component 1